jgi:CHASE3 domain sensor protein
MDDTQIQALAARVREAKSRADQARSRMKAAREEVDALESFARETEQNLYDAVDAMVVGSPVTAT